MDWNKVLKKGLEGAILGGGCAGAATQEALSTGLCALIGFLLTAGKNWWKHRGSK